MVIFVEYHLNKAFFIKHKKEIQQLLLKPAFDIAVMKFEKGMSYRKIAKQQAISVRNVRLILSNSCKQLRLNIKLTELG